MNRQISLLLVVFSFVSCSVFAGIAGDFDNSGSAQTNDTVVLIAWLQERVLSLRDSSYKLTIENVDSRAEGILGSSINTSRLPDPSIDDFGDLAANSLTTDDVVIMISFVIEKTLALRNGTSFTATDVEARANGILRLSSGVGKLPETPVGDSTVPVTITGIQVDP